MAACDALTQVAWMRNLMEELGIGHEKPTLHVDNIPAIRTLQSEGPMKGTKHVALKQQYVRNEIDSSRIAVAHVQASDQLADILTKPLNGHLLVSIRNKIGLE